MVKNLLLQPNLVLGKIISLDTLEYLAWLIFPILWGLAPEHLLPLICAAPILVLNILSNDVHQRLLTMQYFLPVLPFLLLAAISSLAVGRGLLRNGRYIVLWLLMAFLLMVRYEHFPFYLSTLDTWEATREAIAQTQTKGSVLTDNQYGSHVTHRPVVKQIYAGLPAADLAGVDYVLLNLRHPWPNTKDVAVSLVSQLKQTQLFQLSYQRDDVYLFVKKS